MGGQLSLLYLPMVRPRQTDLDSQEMSINGCAPLGGRRGGGTKRRSGFQFKGRVRDVFKDAARFAWSSRNNKRRERFLCPGKSKHHKRGDLWDGRTKRSSNQAPY